MARIIKQESVTYDRTVKERSWRVELLTEIPQDELANWNDYPVVVHRELAELSDPTPPGGDVFYRGPYRPRNREIPADPGPVADGQDGTDPRHYEEPAAPFLPKVRFTLTDIVNATDDLGNPQTVDLLDGDGNVVMADFPMALIPSAIIAGIEAMVDKAHAREVAAAIARAVEVASGED